MADFTGRVHVLRLSRITNSVPVFPSAPPVRHREMLTLLRGPVDAPLMEIRGSGTISGTTLNDDNPDYPVRRRVRLYAEYWGKLVAETFSDAQTGAFTFAGWNKAQRFSVIAYDHTGMWGAVIMNGVFPK